MAAPLLTKKIRRKTTLKTLEVKSDFSFLNRSSIERNIKEMFNYHFGEEIAEKIAENEIKEYYFKALNELQSTKIPFDNNEILIVFDSEELCNLLIEHKTLDKEDTDNNKHIFPENERDEVIYKITKAIELLKVLNPVLSSMITRHFGTIYVAKKKGFGGGTVSSLLGLLWLNPPKKWNIVDYAEALYHEFIHNSLFLDDMVNSIFPDPEKCTDPEALTTSTILKKKRPIDRSFHAANVAIGIMHFYYMLGDPKQAYKYKEDLNLTINELNQRTQFFGERGLEILEQMNHFNKNYDFDSITHNLNN